MPSALPGLARARLDLPPAPRVEYVQRGDQMRRLLAFARRSIDDVVNCPVARQEVILYFRLGKQMQRIAEIDALEKQWNPLGIF